jgi:hypothetical protein
MVPPPLPDRENFAKSDFLEGFFEMENRVVGGRRQFTHKRPEAKESLDSYALPKEGARPSFPTFKNDKRTDLVAWQKFFHRHSIYRLPSQSGEPAHDILLALSNGPAPLEEIARDLRQRPFMRAPLYYERRYAMSLPHLVVFQNLARLYQLHALASLATGDGAAAFEDIRTMRRLRNVTEPGQTIMGNLVAVTIDHITRATLREGFATRVWTEAQLREIASIMGSDDSLTDYAKNLRHERITFLLTAEDTRSVQTLPGNLIGSYFPKATRDFDRVFYCDFTQQQLDNVLRSSPTSSRVARAKERERHLDEESRKIPSRFLRPLSFLALPTLTSVIPTVLQDNASSAMTQVALAIERYRILRGVVPDHLPQLVPDFLPAVPLDPIDGQPLRYQKTDSASYKIWSIGWNEKDESGTIHSDRKQGDWVWSGLPPNPRSN